MASKIEAIMAINANAEVTVTDSVIDWLDTTPISDSDIDAKVTELQAAEDAKETAKTNAKVSGNTKLLGLGLSQEEATALTGYTPE
jgi:hypothetical protein|tara:strand:+ start:614 stop:871 length:258 start_codon:yes stop_codon:yes gene_type:complete